MENAFQRDFDIVSNAFMSIFCDPVYRQVYEMKADVETGDFNKLEIREKSRLRHLP